MTTERINVRAVLEACSAYVDDAACFPEQFKPGLVKRHQREYADAIAAVAELIEATKELRSRYVALFDLYQRPTYHESSRPDSDLELALATTDAALARMEPQS